MTKLQLRSDQTGGLLKRICKMQAAQFLRHHFPRLLFVAFKKMRLLCGEVAIQHIEIGFVVQTNRAVIEITRSDRDENVIHDHQLHVHHGRLIFEHPDAGADQFRPMSSRSEEHTSELQSHSDLVCRLLLEKKKKRKTREETSVVR